MLARFDAQQPAQSHGKWYPGCEPDPDPGVQVAGPGVQVQQPDQCSETLHHPVHLVPGGQAGQSLYLVLFQIFCNQYENIFNTT